MEANFNYRTVEGSLVPRLVQDTDSVPNSANNEPNVQTVTLASPLNGQFYVIGAPSELLSTSPASVNQQRSLAPRTLTLDAQLHAGSKQIELKDLNRTANSLTDKMMKEEKLGNRRATHNEVERRRRDNINHWIMKLGKLIPPETDEDPLTMNGSKQALSKGGILAKACEYLTDIRETNSYLRESLAEKEEVIAENERLQAEIEKLQQENARLRQELASASGGHHIQQSKTGGSTSSLLTSSTPPSLLTAPDGEGGAGGGGGVGGGGAAGGGGLLSSGGGGGSAGRSHEDVIKRDINFGL